MLYLSDCITGHIINLYAADTTRTSLAPYSQQTLNLVRATYLGYYPNNMDSSDQCLIGWKTRPILSGYIAASTSGVPEVFESNPQVANSREYKYFRWCGKGRYVHEDIGPDGFGSLPSSVLKPGQLSPVHAPGWHQCRCGFRNQDISISAIIAGKYVCYQCRNIWKNNA